MKPLAQKLMIVGGSLYVFCLILGFIVNWSVYGKVNDCLRTSCSLSWEQVVGKIAAYIGYVGIFIFIIGLLVFVVATTVRKKDSH